jgi:hypothetical protein
LVDTDHGGVSDGNEDTNLNGRVDGDETDPTPNHGQDDFPPDIIVIRACNIDADCGSERSGVICKADKCVWGCRGTAGNRCPGIQTCSSRTAAAGSCSGPAPTNYTAGDADAGTDDELPRTGATANAVSSAPVPVRLYGGGGDCHVIRAAGAPSSLGYGVYGLALLGWFVRRRNRR